MSRLLVLVLLFAVAGCSSSTPATGDPAKKITWTEYQKMDAEQKDDPYVLDNLDDEAKKKLAESQRKKKR
jgi:predicted small lipoprotein YifL